MSYTRFVLLSPEPERPSPWLTIDAAGMVVSRGMLSAAAPSAAGDVRTLLILPGADVAARWVEVAASTPAQAAAAAAVQLEDEFASAAADLHVVAGAPEADGARLVCVIARERMRAFLDQAAVLGVDPEVAVPDYLLLPEPADETLQAADMGETVAVRGRRVAFGCERGLVPVLAAGRPFQTIADPAVMEGLFADAAANPPLNLRQGAFAVAPEASEGWRDFRRAAILAGLLLLSPIILLAARAIHDTQEARALEAEAQSRAEAIVGEVPGDAVDVLTARVAGAGGGDRFLGSAAAVFDATARIGGQLQAFAYQPDGAMRASLIHDNFTDVETLRAVLEPAGLTVREDASSETGGRIQTDLTLSPAS